MNSFILPRLFEINNFDNLIIGEFNDINNINCLINQTLSKYLNNIKLEIENIGNKWDIYKKYTNPYEYIHTNIDHYKYSVCKYRPLSRSFYKMIEICHNFKIFNNIDNSINTFHLAEGPGGFIEAVSYLRGNKNDKYFGMTLINNNDSNIPGWNKSSNFLKKNSNILLEYGCDNTGNLMNCENLKYIHKKYKNSCYFVTADGGFDFTINFNNQEIISSNLIFCQVAFIIATQKYKGCSVIKMFDTFTKTSIDILFILSYLYEEVNIIKLNTSRYANSEKYIVCKYFKLKNVDNLINIFYNIINNIQDNKFISSILNYKIPYLFINKLEEYNSIFGQQQIENICCTLNLINNNNKEKLEILKKNNIQKCINWCIKYNFEYNKIYLLNNYYIKHKKNNNKNRINSCSNNKITISNDNNVIHNNIYILDNIIEEKKIDDINTILIIHPNDNNDNSDYC